MSDESRTDADVTTGSEDDPPQVRFEAGRGWICSCTSVWIERVDFDLDCHHWPLCEHVVAAARAHARGQGEGTST